MSFTASLWRSLARYFVPAALILVLACGGPVDGPEPDDDDTAQPSGFAIDGDRMWADVAWLASDELAGRAPGSEGNEAALAYVETLLGGLSRFVPAGEGGLFRKELPFPSWEQHGQAVLTLDGEEQDEGDDFAVLAWSGSADVAAELVFAGYGLSVPPFDPADQPGCPLPSSGYDDYAALDVVGKVVVVLADVPGGDRDIASWCLPAEPAPVLGVLGIPDYAAINAAWHGAAAIVLVPGPRRDPDDGAGIAIAARHHDPDLGVLFARRDAIEEHVPGLADLAQAIDSALAPASLATGVDVALTVDADVHDELTANLVTAVPGADPDLSGEVIVLGAHIDHIGVDARTGEIYPGADDNASGSAVLMELARALQDRDRPPARTVVLSWWNADEMGLLGSRAYVEDPPFPLAATRAALSVDMVGGGDATGLRLYGSLEPRNAWLADVMEAAVAEAGLPWSVERRDVAGEGATCFPEPVPAVLASTIGAHGTFHTPEDTPDCVLPADLEVAAVMLWLTMQALADDPSL